MFLIVLWDMTFLELSGRRFVTVFLRSAADQAQHASFVLSVQVARPAKTRLSLSRLSTFAEVTTLHSFFLNRPTSLQQRVETVSIIEEQTVIDHLLIIGG